MPMPILRRRNVFLLLPPPCLSAAAMPPSCCLRRHASAAMPSITLLKQPMLPPCPQLLLLVLRHHTQSRQLNYFNTATCYWRLHCNYLLLMQVLKLRKGVTSAWIEVIPLQQFGSHIPATAAYCQSFSDKERGDEDNGGRAATSQTTSHSVGLFQCVC